jgi:hypothetical protein
VVSNTDEIIITKIEWSVLEFSIMN